VRFSRGQECVLCILVTPLWIEEYGNTATRTCKDDDEEEEDDDGEDDYGDEHVPSRTV